MARLNEPPAAAAPAATGTTTDTVDSLKRRFVRQNRELAKNNSNQSLRIRSLELEVSRLHSDSLELRSDNRRLQHELSRAHAGGAGAASVRKIKEELQAKMMGLGNLFADMNAFVTDITEAQEEHSNEHQLQQPPVEMRMFEGCLRVRHQPLTDFMRENQMPTIIENKSYPRRTIGADEIEAIRLSDHSSNESPDIGPPPVARFDCEDAARNASPLVNKMSPLKPPADGEDDMLPASLSVNLETRRKRKDGGKRNSLLPESPNDTDAPSILRTGAKRKLADRETEKVIKPPSKDDFSFSRKSDGAKAEGPAKEMEVEPTAAIIAPLENKPPLSPKPARKVLGDKSVNMSPRKAVPVSDKPGAEKPEPEKPGRRDRSGKPASSRFAKPKEPSTDAGNRKRRVSSVPQAPGKDEVVNTVELSLPTAAANPLSPPSDANIFSPGSSETPVQSSKDVRGDTPPPGDLSTMSEGGGTRPSRRARSAVNYAEPSLNVKMRRSEKKLGDAVTGARAPSRSTFSAEREGDLGVRAKSTPRGAAGEVHIKQEPMEEGEQDGAWKDLPSLVVGTLDSQNSPLGENGGPAVDDIRRNPAPEISKPGSEQPSRPSIEETARKMEEMDLYDFKESSPTDSSGAKQVGEKPARERGATNRRHSSVPKKAGQEGVGDALGGPKGVTRSERAAGRRKSMML